MSEEEVVENGADIDPFAIEASMNKETLKLARTNKFDEFYTKLPDIEAELNHYRKCFKDKVVYCNTDYICNVTDVHDKRNSMFFTYFYEQFQRLKLKALICSWWDEGSGKLHCVRYNGKDKPVYGVIPDPTDGSCFGDMAIRLLDACDIVVTNPPFSTFREFLKLVRDHHKDYIIIAPTTAASCKDAFTEIMEGRAKVGYTSPKQFYTARNRPPNVKAHIDDKTGRLVFKRTSLWLTSLLLDERPDPIELWKTYKEGDFLHYDNLQNAIDVPSPKDIPKDWPGLIGTSVTILESYNPDQFKIVGLGAGKLFKAVPGATGMSAKFIDDYHAAGGKGDYRPGHPMLGYYQNGIAKAPFARVIVQNKAFIE